MVGQYDKIIIGAGLYGLYAAYYSVRKGEKVLILEYDNEPFSRASYINQARLHNGYHYPRSFSTAASSIKYFRRFNEEFGFCVNSNFKKIYAVAKHYSWTNAAQFEDFCRRAQVPCRPVNPDTLFVSGACESMYETEEFTYDAMMLKDYLVDYLKKSEAATLICNSRIETINKEEDQYVVKVKDNDTPFRTGYLLNTTYSSVNQLNRLAGFPEIKIKYELCEVILCQVSDALKHTGITLMDGPFFSLMPFGKTGLHSLTAVNYTPHFSCDKTVPEFRCQQHKDVTCSPLQLDNCNSCIAQPRTSWRYMEQMARKYLRDDIDITYHKSLFSVKSILKQSEVDDSRHTMMQVNHNMPKFVSVLSGKVNTIYDLEEIL